MLNKLQRALLPLVSWHPRGYEAALDLKDRIRGVSTEDRRRKALNRRVVSLHPDGGIEGSVLISLLVEPLLSPEAQVSHHHTIYWETQQMARTYLDLGYAVDVFQWTNNRFRPEKEYRLVIDVGRNLERLSPLLDSGCTKVLHTDAAHWLYHTTAQNQRLLALLHRRGVSLRPAKEVSPNLGIEHADCAVVLGNQFTIDTFAYAGKPIFRVPISTPLQWPWPADKDFDACRKRFLWFGSLGAVHKGLDLVLEAFAGMPDHHLTVCGPIDSEPEFVEAFHVELFETPNIETHGWIDIADPAFTELARCTLAVVFPSCSEGGGGGVITCIHAAMLPIVTPESSVDIEDFGVPIAEASVAEVRRAVRYTSQIPSANLEARVRRGYDFVRARHTRESFSSAYRSVAGDILSGRFPETNPRRSLREAT